MPAKRSKPAAAERVKTYDSPAFNLSAHAFAHHGNDARLYNGVRDLERALIAAVKVIHDNRIDGYPDKREMRLRWCAYWRNSPEMAPIRAALAGVDLDEPEKLLKEAR